MDQHLYTTQGPPPNTVLWRPRQGSSVPLSPDDYRPFSQVVRTVHLNEALRICIEHGMRPKPVVSLSTLKGPMLYPNHPCKYLHVLWFGAKLNDKDEDAHDWYGNVEFAVPTSLLMERWKNLYLVEIMTAPTHSCSRILVTNNDYSTVLPAYDPCRHGGPWHLTPDGRHMGLVNCRRYNSEGYNRHGHSLEFMIEVTPYGMMKILEESLISFRNHEEARRSEKHVCHRYKGYITCPSPFSKACASRLYFKEHNFLITRQRIATPRLSQSAEKYLQCFVTMEGVPRHIIVAPPPAPPPPLSRDLHFPPLTPPRQTIFQISHILRQRMENGRLMRHQQIIGRGQDSEFHIIAKSISNPYRQEEEKEEVGMVIKQNSRPRIPPGPPPGFFPLPPPGFFPLPPPPGPPPLHLPPPIMPHPVPFQHGWAPLQPVTFRRQN